MFGLKVTGGRRASVSTGLLAAGLLFTTAARAQMQGMDHTAPPAAASMPAGVAAEVMRSYNALKPNVIKAAENMPADAFQFKPTPDVRTYARIINHIIEAQNRSCAVASGSTVAVVKPPSDTADKDTIVAALKASFALCDTAYTGVTDANATEMLPNGATKRSRIGLLWGNVSHDNEQYSALAMYMRLKGLVPPSSEK